MGEPRIPRLSFFRVLLYSSGVPTLAGVESSENVNGQANGNIRETMAALNQLGCTQHYTDPARAVLSTILAARLLI